MLRVVRVKAKPKNELIISHKFKNRENSNGRKRIMVSVGKF